MFLVLGLLFMVVNAFANDTASPEWWAGTALAALFGVFAIADEVRSLRRATQKRATTLTGETETP